MLGKIATIIKSKVSSKANMPEWYYERLAVCQVCEFNSGNQDKVSLADKIRLSHNFGADACLVCSCGIQSKSSVPSQQCPKKKWLAQESMSPSEMKITVDSKLVSFGYDNTISRYIADYGDIMYASASEFIISIPNQSISNLKVGVSCGCTTADIKYKDKSVEITVEYDTRRKGVLAGKDIILSYTKDNKKRQTIIQLTGNVK